MERAEEGEEDVPFLVDLRNLDRGLVRLRTGVPEEHLLPVLAGRDLPQAFREPCLNVVVEIGPREMRELGGLLRDGVDDLRVRVADIEDRDAGGEVDQEVSVHVFDDGAGGPADHDRS